VGAALSTLRRVRRLLSGTAVVLLLAANPDGAGQADDAGPPRFHHLHLNSADPAGTVRFYQQQFSTVVPTTVAGFPGFRTGSVLVLLSTRAGAPPVGQSAYWHFGWHVPSARTYWERYHSTGAPLTPLHADDGGTVTFSNEWFPGTLTRAAAAAARAKGAKAQVGGYGYLTGPDGEWIEFAGDHPAERFNHVHMFQEHVFCAELWYAKHFQAPVSPSARRSEGRKTSEQDCAVPGGEPSWLSLVPEGTRRQPAGGVAFGDVELNWYQRQGSQPLISSRGQVMDHVGLQVRNLNAWLTRLRQNGVRVLRKPYRFGAGRAALIEGPSREVIELVEVP
jgi:hypothetical protein